MVMPLPVHDYLIGKAKHISMPSHLGAMNHLIKWKIRLDIFSSTGGFLEREKIKLRINLVYAKPYSAIISRFTLILK